MKLHDRLKRLESRRQSEMVEIVVRGGLPDQPEAWGGPRGQEWRQHDGEGNGQFRDRVLAEANHAGCTWIVWSQWID